MTAVRADLLKQWIEADVNLAEVSEVTESDSESRSWKSGSFLFIYILNIIQVLH